MVQAGGTTRDRIAMLARAAGLGADRVRELDAFAREHGMSLVRTLIERGGVDDAALLERLAEEMGLQFLAAPPTQVADEAAAALPASIAVAQGVAPVALEGGAVLVATDDPTAWRAWDELRTLVPHALRQVVATRATIEKVQRSMYGVGGATVERLVANREAAGAEGDVGVLGGDVSEEQAANQPTVVNLVNRILAEAIRSRATDIHLEPFEDRYRIRLRVDGVLETVHMPVNINLLKHAVVSRVKIMSHLDITEKRLPQDGRCQFTMGEERFDMRVSILPGVHGEAVNIRVQSRSVIRLDLASLGYEERDSSLLEGLVEKSHGLVLVTGPTGSGKTTTLYALLQKINRGDRKIITIEDPIEYWMDDILQMQVHDEIGFTFSRALRSMLRHDPDVMLLGEVRDEDSAEIAIRSSLTGHLVLATLHTNDAPSAVTRLQDLGVAPYLIANCLLGVVAQRLVRRVCGQCGRDVGVDALADAEQSAARTIGLSSVQRLRLGQGCETCRFTGYRGRLAVVETFAVDAAIRALMQGGATADALRALAHERGMRSLRDAAIDAVRRGLTTPSECVRMTQEDA